MNLKKWNKFLSYSYSGLVISFSLALGTTLFLFYFMSVLISNTPDFTKKEELVSLIEFIRTKPRSFLDEKKRKLPKKAKKQKKPPKMKMLSSALAKPKKINPNMNLPDLKSSLRGSGPAIGGMGISSMGSEVTPLIRIEPNYPRKAAMQGIEGWVQLKFNITPSGSVSDVKILDSKPPRIFDRSAVRALLKWKYRPKIEDGVPVEQKNLKVQLDFKLE